MTDDFEFLYRLKAALKNDLDSFLEEMSLEAKMDFNFHLGPVELTVTPTQVHLISSKI